MKHLLASLMLALISTALTQAQIDSIDCVIPNPIQTTNPFLTNPADARAGGMGYTGIANSKGAAAQHFNSAQLAFSENPFGLTLSIRNPISDNFGDTHFYGAGYYQLNDKQTIGMSYHRLHIGDKNVLINGEETTEVLGEYAVSGSYNRKISNHLALGIGLKYIHSNLFGNVTIGGETAKAAHTYAGDFSLNYRHNINLSKGEGLITFGTSINNLGRKLAYLPNSSSHFLPATLGIGLGFDYQMSPNHSFNFAFDMNRYLAPTKMYYGIGFDITDFQRQSVLEGAINSLWEAPCGYREKVQENMYAIGIEYQFKNLSLRAGHYNSHKNKDDLKAITAGIGYDFSHFSVNISYAKNYRKQTYYSTIFKSVYQATISFDLIKS